MKSLILLAVLGVSMALPQGFYLNDTPDVQAEKHRFFQMYNAMAAAAAAAPDIHIYSRKVPVARAPAPVPQAPVYASAYTAQPQAYRPVQNNALPQQAADVEAATAQFFRAYQNALKATLPAKSRKTYAGFNPVVGPAPQRKWTGPLAATVPASLPGSSLVVAETPEVRAAKAAFASAFQHQLRAVMSAPANAYA